MLFHLKITAQHLLYLSGTYLNHIFVFKIIVLYVTSLQSVFSFSFTFFVRLIFLSILVFFYIILVAAQYSNVQICYDLLTNILLLKS